VECFAGSFPRSWASTGARSLGLQSCEKDYNGRRHEEKKSHGGNLDNLTQRVSHRAIRRRLAASARIHAQSRAECGSQELFSETGARAQGTAEAPVAALLSVSRLAETKTFSLTSPMLRSAPSFAANAGVPQSFPTTRCSVRRAIPISSRMPTACSTRSNTRRLRAMR